MRSLRKSKSSSEDSYFVTMSDIFVGMLFIFLIIISYFIFQIKTETNIENEQYRDSADLHKSKLLQQIRSELVRDGIRVKIVKDQDILTLPEGVLFESGKTKLNKSSKNVIDSLSRAFSKVLECSVYSEKNRPMLEYKECKKENADKVFIESIFIEGHTDNVPVKGQISGSPGINSNLRLSARRATETFRELTKSKPKLDSFFSPAKNKIFAVSAYGETRPFNQNKTNEERAKNRRSDIRLIMFVPSNSKDLNNYKQRLEKEFSLKIKK